MAKKRLIVAMTGASGSVLALGFLRALAALPDWEAHFIMSRGAEITAGYELPGRIGELLGLADYTYGNGDIAAAVASGSFKTEGMAVIPCSMKTVAGIHSGYSDSLILRAADVTLKEGRPLVIAPRETPLSPVHLRNLYELSLMGVSVIPPMMTFYSGEDTAEGMTAHLIGKISDRLGIPCGYKRWRG